MTIRSVAVLEPSAVVLKVIFVGLLLEDHDPPSLNVIILAAVECPLSVNEICPIVPVELGVAVPEAILK
jgi:hypothetical protein